jgi:catechol 2,3-dioxygenase
MLHESPIWPAQLDHFRINAPNPSSLAEFYCNAIGYEISPLENGDLFLQGQDRRLIIGKGETHKRPYHAFRLQSRQQLDEVRSFLQAQGVNCLENPSPLFENDSLAVVDPDGWVSVFGLGRSDLPSRKASNNRPPLSMPGRLQHIVVATSNLEQMIAFYEKTLAFSPSDYVLKDINDKASKHVAFWRTDEEHHSFAAFGASSSRHDHHAYETSGWMAIRDWADHFANLDIPIWWGPGRHGAGNNLFFMIEDPLGDKIEISAEIEKLDRSAGPRWWDGNNGKAVNLWGAGWARD